LDGTVGFAVVKAWDESQHNLQFGQQKGCSVKFEVLILKTLYMHSVHANLGAQPSWVIIQVIFLLVMTFCYLVLSATQQVHRNKSTHAVTLPTFG
jgi:hypothetical protein